MQHHLVAAKKKNPVVVPKKPNPVSNKVPKKIMVIVPPCVIVLVVGTSPAFSIPLCRCFFRKPFPALGLHTSLRL
jgi:hypothetical protein